MKLGVFALAGTLAVGAGMAHTGAEAAPQRRPRWRSTIHGTVSYLQRIALPPGAQVEVKLVEMTRAERPIRTVATETFRTKSRQVPIPFTLSYRTSEIERRKDYALLATISVNGEARFVTRRPVPVLTQGMPKDNVEMVLQSAGQRLQPVR